jgi:hypothetical protein
MNKYWDEKVVPIGGDTQAAVKPKAIIMQFIVFRSEDYKTADRYSKVVSDFIYSIQKKGLPVQLTSLSGEVHVLYGSDLS